MPRRGAGSRTAGPVIGTVAVAVAFTGGCSGVATGRVISPGWIRTVTRFRRWEVGGMSTRLTPYERRRLASIELRLSADDPELAEALRTFRPPPEQAGGDRPVRTFVADLLAGVTALPSAMRAELTRAAAAAVGLCAVVLAATQRLVGPRRRAPRSA